MKMKQLLVVGIILAAFLSNADLPTPVVRWRMDTISGGVVKDVSGNNRDLTLGADCYLSNVVYGAGKKITTLYMPGTSNAWAKFSCPALTRRTFSAWVFHELGDGPLAPSPNDIPTLCNGISSLIIQCPRTRDYVQPWFAGYNGSTSVQPGIVLDVIRGCWEHIAIVVDITGTGTGGAPTGTMTTYRNGKVRTRSSTITFPASLATANEAAIIGNTAEKGHRPFFGHIGEIRLYDAALADAQILEIYREARNGLLIAHWDMESIETDSDNARFIAGSGGGPNLNLGDAVTVMDGIDGHALRFNPQDQETLSTTWSCATGGLTTCTEATVSLWLNADRDIKTTQNILNANGEKNNIPSIWQDSQATRLSMNSGFELDPTERYLHIILAGNSLNKNFNGYVEKGRWSHVATTIRLVSDGSSPTGKRGYVEIFVDGEKLGDTIEDTNVPENLFANGALNIGSGISGGVGNIRVFKGMVDDFRVYDGILTPTQIRDVFRSPAKVSAGDDFITASEKATLYGTVGDSAQLPCRHGFAGDIKWEVLSTPPGGEATSIESPQCAVTRVTLPVEGTYRFRLVSTAVGASRASDVTVVRVPTLQGNVAPSVTLASSATFPFQGFHPIAATVSDPDTGPGTLRTFWRKVSGPGGVWFEPAASNATAVCFSAVGTYVLRCMADDGQDATSSDITVTVESENGFDPDSITNGLIGYWPLNGDNKSLVAGAENMSLSSIRTHQHYEPALDGFGYRGNGFDSYGNLHSTGFREPGDNNAVPSEKWRTVSLWMYHDATNPGTNVCWNPSLVSQREAFDLMYLLQADGGSHGFWIYQASGGNKYDFTPPTGDPANRWTHVYVAFDRMCDNSANPKRDDSELWIDGVKLTPSTVGYGKARCRNKDVAVGGCSTSTTWFNIPDGCWSNETYGVMSRTFPGIIDELRLYNRKLTPEEIRYLAAHPVIDANKAPSTSIPEISRSKVVPRMPVQVTVTAHDDGIPYDSSLTYRWSVISGDADKVAFSSTVERATSVTFAAKGEYVLQLEISDGERTTYSDPVVMTVDAAGSTMYIR